MSTKFPLRLLAIGLSPRDLEEVERAIAGSGSALVAHAPADSGIFEAPAEVRVPADVVLLADDPDVLAHASGWRLALPEAAIVLVTRRPPREANERLTADEACDLALTLPAVATAVETLVQAAGELMRQRRQVRQLREMLSSTRDQALARPVYQSASATVEALVAQAEAFLTAGRPLLILGEPGTGKDLLARHLHRTLGGAPADFREIDAASWTSLFAPDQASADPGNAYAKLRTDGTTTLYLRGLHALTAAAEEALAEQLRDGMARGTIPRLIASMATGEGVRRAPWKGPLAAIFEQQRVELPPLRARPEDIDLLMARFLRGEGVDRPRIDPEALRLLHAATWPGNVRELRNFCRSIVLLAERRDHIREADVRAYLAQRMGGEHAGTPAAPAPGASRETVRPLDELERAAIAHALEVYGGNVSRAAEALGIGRSTLYRHLGKNAPSGGTADRGDA